MPTDPVIFGIMYLMKEAALITYIVLFIDRSQSASQRRIVYRNRGTERKSDLHKVMQEASGTVGRKTQVSCITVQGLIPQPMLPS